MVSAQERCEPSDTPRRMREYDSRVAQLDIGMPGKVGIIDVTLRTDRTGRTVMSEQFYQTPLQVQRVVYPDDVPARMAQIYLMSVSGGILQGDRNRIDIKLSDEAAARILTQGATRVYSMDASFATQMVNITTEDGCYLEYLPHCIIPYRNARYYQRTHIRRDGGVIICSEMLVPGRVASGESFLYDICYLRTMYTDRSGVVKFLENQQIEPHSCNPEAMNGFSVMGTVYAFFDGTSDVEERVVQDMDSVDGTISGTSLLPDQAGIMVRVLGRDAICGFDAVNTAVRSLRRHIPGSPFSDTA